MESRGAFSGHADVPLNEKGLAQAEATGRRIAAECSPAAIYSSPLARAVKTAEAVAWHFSLSVRVHPGLIDIHYGEWQGLTPDEARARWPEVIEAWYNAPHTARIPGGETLDELRICAESMVNELATRHEGQTIVLMGHTVINRIILLAVLGLGNDHFWRLRQDTCAINTFEAEDRVFTIGSLNETYHLRSKI